MSWKNKLSIDEGSEYKKIVLPKLKINYRFRSNNRPPETRTATVIRKSIE
ncbi:MAG: hypothetical protein EZS28_016743, partial [Streblomastix strix]